MSEDTNFPEGSLIFLDDLFPDERVLGNSRFGPSPLRQRQSRFGVESLTGKELDPMKVFTEKTNVDQGINLDVPDVIGQLINPSENQLFNMILRNMTIDKTI